MLLVSAARARSSPTLRHRNIGYTGYTLVRVRRCRALSVLRAAVLLHGVSEELELSLKTCRNHLHLAGLLPFETLFRGQKKLPGTGTLFQMLFVSAARARSSPSLRQRHIVFTGYTLVCGRRSRALSLLGSVALLRRVSPRSCGCAQTRRNHLHLSELLLFATLFGGQKKTHFLHALYERYS